jgi:hypothetical protein
MQELPNSQNSARVVNQLLNVAAEATTEVLEQDARYWAKHSLDAAQVTGDNGFIRRLVEASTQKIVAAINKASNQTPNTEEHEGQ